MAVNIKKLKQQKIRKIIPITVDGEVVENIEIYNITQENRAKFDEILMENFDLEQGQINIDDEKLIHLVFTTLTNIEFDSVDEVMEVLAEPSQEMREVDREIKLILTAYANEKLQDQMVQLNELMSLMNQAQVIEQAHKLSEMSNVDIESVERSAEELIKAIQSDKELRVFKGKKQPKKPMDKQPKKTTRKKATK